MAMNDFEAAMLWYCGIFLLAALINAVVRK
jgi:hypothetical protein